MVFLLLVASFTLSVGESSSAATTWFVGPGGGGGSCSTPSFATIQSAVDTAVAGDTIQVCAGTYDEQVSIDKAITLRGAQYGIAGSLHAGAESVVKGFSVTNANVIVDGFKVDPGTSASGVGLTFVGGTAETVEDNIITDYGYDATAHQGSEAVLLSGTSGMLFQHNLLENPTATGQAQFSSAAAQNGVFAGSGVSNDVEVLNNVFRGASTYPGTDIGLSYTSGTSPVISGNVSTGGATLVTLFNSTGGEVTNNTFTGDPNVTGSVIYVGGGDTNTTISNNSVSGGYFGVAFRNVYGDGPNGTATVTGNSLTGNYGGGVSLSGTAIASNSSVVVRSNNLGGYSYTALDTTCGDDVATCGANNATSYTLDATNNYWGSASGPYNAVSNPSGTGSPVSAQTTFSPWWTTSNGRPNAPTAISATLVNTSANVSWAAPTLTGSSDNTITIASYTVTASGTGGQSCTTTTSTTCTVNGLARGATYTFSVTASNSSGGSGASANSNSITLAVPAPPTTGPPNAAPPTGVPPSSLGAPTSVTASPMAPTVVSQSSNGASETISVPAGALPSGTTVSVYPVTNTAPLVAQVPSGQSYVVSLAVTWQAPDGTSPVASAPITMSISDPNIVAGDTVYEVTASGLVAVGTADANGSVTITFSTDPVFIVAAPMIVAQAPLVVTSLRGSIGTPLRITTSGGSGTGALTYTVINGTAYGCRVTISGLLSALKPGTCLVTATKASDPTHPAASSVPTTVTMAPAATPSFTSQSGVELSFGFSYYSSVLSARERMQLRQLARKLPEGTLVTFTGYADFDIPLAQRRATTVAMFLSSLVHIRVRVRTVTDVCVRKTTISYGQPALAVLTGT